MTHANENKGEKKMDATQTKPTDTTEDTQESRKSFTIGAEDLQAEDGFERFMAGMFDVLAN